MFKKQASLKSILFAMIFSTFGLLLAACGDPTTDLAPQAIKGFQAAPLSAQGSELFFGQLAKNQSLIKPLITSFETNPRKTYLEVIALDSKQKTRFVALKPHAVNVLVDSLVNILETTEEAHSQIGPVKPAELVWYYIDCNGNVSSAPYNETFETQGYFLTQDPPPSLGQVAAWLNGC